MQWMDNIHKWTQLDINVTIEQIFSANQRFCWAPVDSFLTVTLLSMPKLLIFWAHQNLSGNFA